MKTAALGAFLAFLVMGPISAQDNAGYELPLVKFECDERDSAVTFHIIKNEQGETARYYAFLEDVSVELRNDKLGYTSVRFQNPHENSSWIRFFKNATILVPEATDIFLWKDALARYKKNHEAYSSKQVTPQRVWPDNCAGNADKLSACVEFEAELAVCIPEGVCLIDWDHTNPPSLAIANRYYELHGIEVSARTDNAETKKARVYIFINDLGFAYAKISLQVPEGMVATVSTELEKFMNKISEMANDSRGHVHPKLYIEANVFQPMESDSKNK